MASITPLMNLTVDGWTNASLQVADQLLADFFLSEYSQTYAFPDNVSSFPWYLERYSNDLNRLSSEIQSALTLYFGRQFNEVEVEVTTEAEIDSTTRYGLKIYLVFKDSVGDQFNLGRLIKYDSSKTIEIIDMLLNG